MDSSFRRVIVVVVDVVIFVALLLVSFAKLKRNDDELNERNESNRIELN